MPTIPTLLETAEKLQRIYGTPAAYHRALNGHYMGDITRVPTRSPWIHPTTENTSLILANEPKRKGTNKGKKEDDDEDIFEGDLVIAQSSRFIHDGMISRHATYAVADGDIGSVWECMKVRHSKYN